MKTGLHIFCHLLGIFFLPSGIAQQPIFHFKHLTIDNGLSQNTINSIHQDRFGFIWLGTQDGLNRYDGVGFVQYRHERNNPNSISNNYIWDIHEDEDGILWLATFGGGLNRLDPLTGEVTCYKPVSGDPASFPSNRLFSIAEYPKGILWIGSNEGLIRFEKSTEQSKIFLARRKPDNTLSDHYIGVVAVDDFGQVWMRSDSGLTSFNTETFTSTTFQRLPFSKTIEIENVIDIKNINNILLITCSVGLVEINLKLKKDQLLLSASDFQTAARNIVFQKVLPLGGHRYAIGTNLGLVILDKNTGKTTFHQNDAPDEKSLSHNNILSLLRSDDGVIWIGTRNGLNLIENERPDFVHIRHIPGKNGLSNKNVNSFIEEQDSLLWIGTVDGLNLFNKNDHSFRVFRSDPKHKNSLTSNYILCLFSDSKGNKWVGTRGGGFYKIEDKTNAPPAIKRIQPVNDTISVINVHCITEDHQGFLWIGTGGAGLWRYNPVDNTVKKYGTAKDGTGPGHPFVFTVLEDSHHNIWIGTPTGGLNLFDPLTEKFIYFQHDPDNENSLCNDIVLSLHEDKNHQLWIGTSGGLSKLLPKIDQHIFQKLSGATKEKKVSWFKNFGHEQGFPNDVIYGILEDNHRHLWLSTNKGLVTFDMDKEAVTRKWDISDGLQSNEFNQNGYYKNDKGFFYFGGVNGFNIFHPDSIRGNRYIPPVVLTGLSLYNEPVKVGSSTSKGELLLEKALCGLDQITLSWRHDVVTFEFVALSYHTPEKNQYSYKLEGFNEEWVQAGNSHTATYTNLDPGDYVFKVRASNSSGIWNETGTALKIKISTPPWLSWYAWLLYCCVGAGAVYLFLRYRIDKATVAIKVQAQIEKARAEEREEFRKNSAADFHDEAGNKITKITLFTEMARAEINDKQQLENYLKKIQLNTAELSSGMRDFLWVMDSQRDTLYETITRLKDFGEAILTETGIRFTVSGMNPASRQIILPMKIRRAILQIFKEAMNNCAKHASAGDVILEIKVAENEIEMVLRDNGKGFDPDEERDKNHYGLKIMQERALKIGANLDIRTLKNKGTTISLICKIPQVGNS